MVVGSKGQLPRRRRTLCRFPPPIFLFQNVDFFGLLSHVVPLDPPLLFGMVPIFWNGPSGFSVISSELWWFFLAESSFKFLGPPESFSKLWAWSYPQNLPLCHGWGIAICLAEFCFLHSDLPRGYCVLMIYWANFPGPVFRRSPLITGYMEAENRHSPPARLGLGLGPRAWMMWLDLFRRCCNVYQQNTL